MQNAPYYIVTFLVITTFLILLLVGFVITILFLYRKKQIAYYQSIDDLKLNNEKNLLKSQIEIQEQTLRDISREIHDNITLSLSLSKLHLITFKTNNSTEDPSLIDSSLDLISKSIIDLSDISKSMNSDIIAQHGLIYALKSETDKIQKTGLFKIRTTINGNPIFLDCQKEIILFRVIQEALNNIIKHSKAKSVNLDLHYNNTTIMIKIKDDGIGFEYNLNNKGGTGLINMKTRCKIFNGKVEINSVPNEGTEISILMPF